MRLFRDVYLPAGIPVTHEIRCQGAALVLPGEAVSTGRSAATLRSVVLARPWDPVELTAPLRSRIARRQGHGGQVGIVDLAFPEARLAVEYDGRWHREWLQVGPDRERLNRLQAASGRSCS